MAHAALKWAALAVAASVAFGALAAACSSRLPLVKTGPRPANEPWVAVPYPPPAARVDFVPPRPNDSAVWVDGQWTWQARRWVWEPGGWVVAPPDSYFVPWTVRLSAGGFLFSTGSWHKEDGTEIPAPAVLAKASTGGAAEATGAASSEPSAPASDRPLDDAGGSSGGDAEPPQ
jgi:hypothetical protein